jgi:HSP20 family protein
MRDLVSWTRPRGTLIQRDRQDPFFTLHREMNRLFDEFSRGFDAPALSESHFAWPSIEVRDEGNVLEIEAELPGMEQKDVEVLLHDNVLTLRGEKRRESQDDKRKWSERFYGQFERRIPLDAEVDEGKVKASFKNGVLRVEVPKSANAEQKTRRIPITNA